jgi:hypothetical protein
VCRCRQCCRAYEGENYYAHTSLSRSSATARRDGERYIVFLGDDRIGFVQRTDNGSWNHVDTTMAHSGYAKTRERAGQLLRRRYERMVRGGEI